MKPAFQDAALPLQKLVVAAARQTLTERGEENPALQVVTGGSDPADATAPYIVVSSSESTESATYEDKDSRPVAMTVTPVIYTRRLVESIQVAGDLTARLTGGVTVEGFRTHRFSLQSRSGTEQRTTEGYTIYQQALIFTLELEAA